MDRDTYRIRLQLPGLHSQAQGQLNSLFLERQRHAVTQTSIFEYQIATTGSNCIPEIVLTGRIQIEPNQTIDLISAAATENQIVCVNNQIEPTRVL